MPVTAVHVLNNDVLPFFDKHRATVNAVISDNGREFSGRPDRHPYELLMRKCFTFYGLLFSSPLLHRMEGDSSPRHAAKE